MVTLEKTEVSESDKRAEQMRENESHKRTRPRSGSWGGANESEDEINVRKWSY